AGAHRPGAELDGPSGLVERAGGERVHLGGGVERHRHLVGGGLHRGLHAGDQAVVAVRDLGDGDQGELGVVVRGGPAVQRFERRLLAARAGEGERGAEAAHRGALGVVGGGGGVAGGGQD